MQCMEVNKIKQRFEIIGNSPALHRAIEIAVQVAPTDLSVLITGESGTGKERFPQIIHQFSSRKHGPFSAVNCGAIPEGTIGIESLAKRVQYNKISSHSTQTIKSAIDTFLPPDWVLLKALRMFSNLLSTLRNWAGWLTSQSFCGAS